MKFLISKLTVILPVYNESESIEIVTQEILDTMKMSEVNCRLLLVDDGSTDGTKDILKRMSAQSKAISYIAFSRNFGKETAILAGICEAGDDFDALAYMDSDGQHDPQDLLKLVSTSMETGAEIVCGSRLDRSYQSFFQRSLSHIFYYLFHALSYSRIEPGVGDFNLMRPKAVRALRKFSENYPFMKGLVSWIGFHREIVPIKIRNRLGGEAKSSSWKMFLLALSAFLSFSSWPLRAWSIMGMISALMAIIYLVFIVVKTIIYGQVVPGYATIVVLLLGLGGLQLLSIGVVGEYISRIYDASKQRPKYIISDSSDE